MRLNKLGIQQVTKWLLAVAVALLTVTAPHAAASATPMLLVTGYPTPGDTLTLEGTRFIPGGTATIYYDNVQIGTAPVRQMLGIVGQYVGGFQTTYSIPFSATLGVHTLQAVEQPGGLTAQTSVTVAASWAQNGFFPTNTRYNPYETTISPSNVSNLTLAWYNSNDALSGAPGEVNGDIYFPDLAFNNLQAMNAATGAALWIFKSPSSSISPSAPAVYNGALYATGGNLYAVSATTGELGWTGATLAGYYPTIFAGGMVYTDDSVALTAFNANGCVSGSCAPIWTLTGARGGPAISGNTLYATGKTGLFVADATTGKVAWTGAVATGDVDSGSPAVDGGYVFLASTASYSASSSTLYAFNASGCGQATCSPVWTATIPQAGSIRRMATGLAVANNTVFVNGVGLYAFPEGGCGASTCSPSWIGQTDQTYSRMIDNAPVVANGVVYVGSEDSNVHAFNANGCGAATCQPLWSYGVDNGNMGSPIVINGMLYIATYYVLYAFSLPSATARQASAVSAVTASYAHPRVTLWNRPSIVP